MIFNKRGCEMGKIIAKNVVQRRAGHLYYVDAKGNVCEAVMARGGRRKKAARRTTARRSTTRRRRR